MLDERVLAERLISYDTSRPEELVAAAGFVKGWLESRDIEVRDHRSQRAAGAGRRGRAPRRRRRPVRRLPRPSRRRAGPRRAVRARIEGDRLIGRGAYDMKGGLAAMMCALKDVEQPGPGARPARVRPRRGVRGDSTSARPTRSSSEGLGGDFAITGEPTDMHIGVEAKGVLVMRIEVHGRAAHSSTPWLGDNAVLKAIDVFRSIESLPFARESSEMFDRPSINLGRIEGGRALNMVPDRCTMAVDVRYLPGQDPDEILAQVRGDRRDRGRRGRSSTRRSTVSRTDPYVRALREAVARSTRGEVMSVGRDGASEAAAFIGAGIPAVEFGPAGGGHHGPDEWVSVSSLARYRRALADFVRAVP